MNFSSIDAAVITGGSIISDSILTINGDLFMDGHAYHTGALGNPSAGQVLSIDGGDNLIWTDNSPLDTFVELEDVGPNSYVGHADKLVQVNASSSGLEFTSWNNLFYK